MPATPRVHTRLSKLAAVAVVLLGCRSTEIPPGPVDRATFVEALKLAPTQPDAAMVRCRRLAGDLAGDCIATVVEANPTDPRAEDWCSEAPSGVARDECHFQLAERTRHIERCASAGAFADDCRLHVWTARVRELPAAQEDLTAWVAVVRQELVASGVDADDPRFWSAAFRIALPRGRALDRARCRTVQARQLREAREATGIAAWHDLLNRERDFARLDCSEGPPEYLLRPDDPELQSILDRRWSSDMCARRRPPP